MVRLTRAQQQQRTRATVLSAAEREFTDHGYGEAKVDRIAERAELTRGAVYSNFPSKRALYLAVLVDLVQRSAVDKVPQTPPATATEAVGTFARVWLERLPLVNDTPASGQLQLRSLAGVLDDEPTRTALAQVIRLEALLLGLALESSLPHRRPPRQVRLAELVLTLLHGSGGLADTAPGFGDPFDVTRACQHLAGISLADRWDPPHLPYVAPARLCHDAWSPPTGLPDEIAGGPAVFTDDGVIAVFGTGRLAAAEETVRAARRGDRISVVVVTSDPAEIGRLVRLRVGDLTGCLRRVFTAAAWPRLQLVLDDDAATAAALGLSGADDTTEAAVRIQGATIVARADGRGAAHAAATAGAPDTTRTRETRT